MSCSPLLMPALVLILLPIACVASWPTAASGKGARRGVAWAVFVAAAAACLPGAAAAPVESSASRRTPHPHPLRRNWYAPPYDPVVHEIDVQMNNCSTTAVMYVGRGGKGYGSVLHTWATYLCYAMESRASLIASPDGPRFNAWDGHGTTVCHKENPTAVAPLTCFYGQRANPCRVFPRGGRALKMPAYEPFFHHGDGVLRHYHDWDGCPSWSHRRGTPCFVAAFRWLFSGLSPRLVKLAREAAINVFGPHGAPDALVTVHMRWGDKAIDKVTLQSASKYAEAVERLVATHLPGLASSKLSVFVTTEDGAALRAFQKEAGLRNWTVYTYAPALLHSNAHFEVGANGSHAQKRNLSLSHARSAGSPLDAALAQAQRNHQAVGWPGPTLSSRCSSRSKRGCTCSLLSNPLLPGRARAIGAASSMRCAWPSSTTRTRFTSERESAPL